MSAFYHCDCLLQSFEHAAIVPIFMVFLEENSLLSLHVRFVLFWTCCYFYDLPKASFQRFYVFDFFA